MEEATTPTRRAPSRSRPLDGLRGFALLGMLAWHAQVGWVQGGFARMTIFFVLSGFLATRSFLRLEAGGWVGATTFWRRRVRRLLPLTVVGVAVAVAVTAAVGSAAARAATAGDAVSVLLGVSNWRFVLESRSYGSLFDHPSAFQHFWSLSAEEQLFWLCPVVLAGVGLVPARWRSLAAGSGAALLLAVPLVVTWSPDAVYYGTVTRGGEFLAGAALALALDRSPALVARRAGAVRLAGTVGLATLVLVMLLVDRSAPWLYRGGMGLVVVPVVAVLAAAVESRGLASRLLSWAPLVVLGRWALSVYVLHWPLYLLVDAATGWTGPVLATVQVTSAVVVGGVVHRMVERPLLAPPARGPASPGWQRWVVPGALAVGVAAVVAAVSLPRPAPTYDFDAAQQLANQGPAPTSGPPRTGTEASPDGPEPPSVPSVDAALVGAEAVGVFGGSTGVALGAAVWDWTSGVPELQAVPAWSRYGCGLLTAGERVHSLGGDGSLRLSRPEPDCLSWQDRWEQAAVANGVQVAMIVTGVWETSDWALDGVDGMRSIGQPEFDELVRLHLDEAVTRLNRSGADVVLTTAPQIGPGLGGRARADRGLPDDHPARVAAYNELIRSVAAAHDRATVIEYGAYIDSFPAETSSTWLPDGIHPTTEAAHRIWSEFLGPELRAVRAAARNPPPG